MGIRSLNEGGKLKTLPFLNISNSGEEYEPYIPTNPWPLTEQSSGIWPPNGYEFLKGIGAKLNILYSLDERLVVGN